MRTASLQEIHADVDKLMDNYYGPGKYDPLKVEASVEALIIEFQKQNPRFDPLNPIDGEICARMRFRAKQIGDKARYEYAMGVIR